jgi:hypothetical protein
MKQIRSYTLVVAFALCGFFTPTSSWAVYDDTVYYLGYSDYLQSIASNNMEFAGYNIANGWSDTEQTYYGWYYSGWAQEMAYYAYVYAPSGTGTQTYAYYAWLYLEYATESAYYFYLYNTFSYWLDWADYSFFGQAFGSLGIMYGAIGY